MNTDVLEIGHSDLDWIDEVKGYNRDQLLDAIFDNPEYLVDGYYYEMGYALVKRWQELKGDE